MRGFKFLHLFVQCLSFIFVLFRNISIISKYLHSDTNDIGRADGGHYLPVRSAVALSGAVAAVCLSMDWKCAQRLFLRAHVVGSDTRGEQ